MIRIAVLALALWFSAVAPAAASHFGCSRCNQRPWSVSVNQIPDVYGGLIQLGAIAWTVDRLGGEVVFSVDDVQVSTLRIESTWMPDVELYITGTVGSFSAIPTAGQHRVSARIDGGQVVTGTFFVKKASSTTRTEPAIVVDRNTVILPVVLSSPRFWHAVTPRGGVARVRSGNRVLGSATVVNGRAAVRLDVSSLAAGPATVHVEYDSDPNFNGSSTTASIIVPRPTVSISDAASEEGTASPRVARVRLGLTPPADEPVEVTWTTADGTAIAGEDYVASSGTARIAAGESGETIEIPLLADDKAEFDETFAVKLTGIRGATLGRRHGTVQITTDDPFFTHHAGQRYGAASAMTLDLRVPRIGTAPHPILIGIEANGWSSPDANGLLTIRQTMRGYAVATVSFRPAREAPFPAQLDDLREAVRWLRANAAHFQLDANRIGVWGIGYGGHLAALLGTHGVDFSSRVQAVVDWYGPTDISGFALTDDEAAANVRQLLGGTLAADLARAASPATHASPDDPPFLIMHGMNDTRVPIAHSEALHRALHDAGVDANLVIVPLAGHGGGVWDDTAVLAQVDAFLDGHLLGGGVR